MPLLEPDFSGLLDLAQALVRIDTTNPPGNELETAVCVADFLEAAGVDVVVQPFGEGRANLVARLRSSDERGALLLSGHLDTVPVDDEDRWSVPPLGAVVRDGHLYGRGALDMKGAVAAMAVAVRNLNQAGGKLSGDVVLALTAGEETDSCGARMLCESGLLEGVSEAIIGEPTDLDVGLAHRGALWVRVDKSGKAAHGSQPAAGQNAVRKLLDWLDPMESIEMLTAGPVDDLLGTGSVSLNMIGGGTSVNVVPNRAHAILDFRTVPGQAHDAILSALNRRDGDAVLTVLRDGPPISVSCDDALARAAIEAVTAARGEPARVRGLPYITDGSVFVDLLGIPAVVLGPGGESRAHTEDECIPIQALHEAAAIYQTIANRLMR